MELHTSHPQHQHAKIAELLHQGGTFGEWLDKRAAEGELQDDDSTLAYFPETIRTMASALGKAHPLDIPLDNKGRYVPNDFAALRARHEQLFPLEHAAFAEARKRFREQLALRA